jgi:hypothetical protein
MFDSFSLGTCPSNTQADGSNRMLKKGGRGSWDDPRARATRGLKRPSLDARSWDHPTHPFKVQLAVALLGIKRVSARQGWVGEKSGLFEHPVGGVLLDPQM